MIIARTPFRVSFFGGGTDYPAWFSHHGGAVLATTINKFCYVTCRHLPPFFEHRSRIAYSLIETVNDNGEIKHPAVRHVLEYLKIREGVEIHYDADLPARTGLGTSSAFTVSLLHALYALNRKMPTTADLARDAVYLEQRLMKENVGCQDQILAAYGGLNVLSFAHDGTYDVAPVILDTEFQDEFEDRLVLCFTGVSRTSSDIAAAQMRVLDERAHELSLMQSMVKEGLALLRQKNLADFGKLLHDAWLLKRSLTAKVSLPMIDEIYDAARAAGATGGKLLGAGGGGFILLFVPSGKMAAVQQRLSGLLFVPFRIERRGSQIIYCEPDANGDRRHRGILALTDEAVPETT